MLANGVFTESYCFQIVTCEEALSFAYVMVDREVMVDLHQMLT